MRFFHIATIAITLTFFTPACFANMIYNPEHSEAMKKLSAVESANVNLQYQCGKFALFISAFATESELNGKNASVSGKITSDKSSHDISKLLSLAISRHDVLTGQFSVACNPEKGAFKLDISPNNYAEDAAGSLTTVRIFADGTVEGNRNF